MSSNSFVCIHSSPADSRSCLGTFWELLAASRRLLGAFWEPLFWETLQASDWQLNSLSGLLGKRPFWAKSWPGSFWKQISGIWRPLGRLLNSPSGILGKRPFWAKSWPGAFWSQILGLWRLAGRQLKAPSGIIGKRLF